MKAEHPWLSRSLHQGSGHVTGWGHTDLLEFWGSGDTSTRRNYNTSKPKHHDARVPWHHDTRTPWHHATMTPKTRTPTPGHQDTRKMILGRECKNLNIGQSDTSQSEIEETRKPVCVLTHMSVNNWLTELQTGEGHRQGSTKISSLLSGIMENPTSHGNFP